MNDIPNLDYTFDLFLPSMSIVVFCIYVKKKYLTSSLCLVKDPKTLH